MQINIHDRIRIILDALGVKPPSVAAKIGDGMQSTKFYNIINGKAKPNWDTIEKLVELFPEINPMYLVKGEGPPVVREGMILNLNLSGDTNSQVGHNNSYAKNISRAEVRQHATVHNDATAKEVESLKLLIGEKMELIRHLQGENEFMRGLLTRQT